MFDFKERIAWLDDTKGQGLIEYALIVLFVAVALVVALSAFGGILNDFYNGVASVFP